MPAWFIAIQPWIGLAGLIVAIGVPVYFHFKQRKVKKPMWSQRGVTVFRDLTDQFSELKVSYGGKDVTRLTLTRLIFWNGGSETIHSDDVPPGDPVRIGATGGVEILSALSSTVDNPANWSVEDPIGPDFRIVFDYLDHMEGMIASVVHTGEAGDVFITGSVMGAKVRRLRSPSKDWDNDTQVMIVAPFLVLALVPTVIYQPPIWAAMLIIIGFAAVGMLVSEFFKGVHNRRLPDSFREFRKPMSI